ncbi:MAG: hypothetical protein LBP50_10890 [Tannerella sp.]|jgi:hypothetical protein|nr:hypothetical protein [Tannerella sp.]
MSRDHYQPVKDGEFIAWAENISAQSEAHKLEWMLSTEDVSELTSLTDDAKASYEANLNRETKNFQTSQKKKVAFARLKRFLSYYSNSLEYNLHVPDEAILAMGLRPREHHAHQPDKPPGEAPNATVVAGQHHDITVYASIPEYGHAVEYLKRKGYYGIKVRYRKEGEDTWHEKVSTRLHVTLVFDETDEARHVEIEVAWINPRLEEGPWSDKVRALIN